MKILAAANGAITFEIGLNFSSFLPDVEYVVKQNSLNSKTAAKNLLELNIGQNPSNQ